VEGDVGHTAAVAAPAEAQDDDAPGGHFLQADAATVGGELRVDLVVDDVADPLHQRCGLGRRRPLDAGGADLQLARGPALLVVDLRAVEVAGAGGVQPEGEAVAVDRPLVALEVGGLGELQAHVGAGGARLDGTQSHAKPRQGLALDQLAEVLLGGIGDLDHAGILASPGCPAAQRPVAVRSALPCAPPETPMNDLIPLAQAHCMPRRGASHRLGDARLRELLPQVPGWEVVEDGEAITRTFRFDDYYRTMAFVNALA